MAQYPVKAGFYDKNELFHLSTTVGYPGDFLVDGFRAASAQQLQSAHLKLSLNRRVSGKIIQDLLNCKHMQSRLEKVFNRYSADFNRKFFAKVLSLLKHRRLSFSEISNARIAFDLYSHEGGGGMLASTETVLQALKMLERVMSPIRLESEIQRQQKTVDLPSCIQVYEFLDLVIKCARSSEVEKEMELKQSSELHDPNDITSVPDFDQLLMTKDKQILAYLDKQYRDYLFERKEKYESSASSSVSERTLTASYREERVASSLRQKRAFTPSLEYSQNQLFRARTGHAVLTGGQCQEIESLQASRQSSRAGKRPTTHSGMQSSLRHGKQGCKQDFSGKAQTPAPHYRGPKIYNHSMQSRSAPTLLPSIQHPAYSDHEDKAMRKEMVVEDLDEEISQICEASVYRASSALRESMSRIALFSNPIEGTSRSTAKTAHRKRTKPKSVEVKMQYQPLVSDKDMERQQGLIDDIQWRELRRKQQYCSSIITYEPNHTPPATQTAL